MTYVPRMQTLMIAVALAAAATACSQQASDSAAAAGDVLALAAPAAAATTAAESNAANNAGDIPDTQAFVRFVGPGYSVLVPEGWARTQHGSAVTFRSNANSVLIELTPDGNYDLSARFHAVGPVPHEKRVTLGGERATLITFRSHSDPNPVTGKRTALENDLYSAAHHGKYVALLLSAPVGADNADQWKRIAQSFRWR